MRRYSLTTFFGLFIACASDPTVVAPPVDAAQDRTQPSVDVFSVDVPTVRDASKAFDVLDASVLTDTAPIVDASLEASIDASDVTSNGSEAILGTLRGMCGTLRTMLRSPAPSLLRNELVFVAPERFTRDLLSPGGQRLFDTENAGGSSGESEVMSFEVLHYCEGASLLRTETEIRYAPSDDSGANSITDILVEIGGERVGVSVTRSFRPMPLTFTDAEVRELIARKLEGINRSTVRVLPADRWVKQVLHVFVANDAAGDQVERVWRALDDRIRADTIVVLTVTRGGGFIYCNPDPPLGTECPPIRM
jgi:hypothetical protein